MRDGPAAGLALIDAILARGDLSTTTSPRGARRPVPAAWADGRTRARSYERALALTRQEPERRFLERRLAELRN